jgi:hypothetical protein
MEDMYGHAGSTICFKEAVGYVSGSANYQRDHPGQTALSREAEESLGE